MSTSMNTELSTASSYNTSNMIFSKPIVGSIPNSVPALSYKRVNISTKNPNGSIGELIFCTSEIFSFGISQNINPDTKKVNGYVMSLCLWNKDGASAEEKAFTDMFDKVVEKCKDFLITNKDELEKYDLELNDLKKFNPLYWKREKGQIVPGTGPSLYVKLIESKKNDKILTQFYDYEGHDIDPMSLMGKYCVGKFAMKIESIFIGNKLSLQVKLYEAQIQVLESGMKRLLGTPRPAPVQGLVSIDTVLPSVKHSTETGSLNGDDTDDVVVQPVVTTTTVPKRVVKRNPNKSSD